MTGIRTPSYDYLIKLIIIGDSGVGKTCLLLRFAEDGYTPTHISTIGIDFKIKTVNIDSKVVKLQIWDTAGQERFRTITQTYYRGAMGIILAYDASNEDSFNNIKNWIKQIEQHAASDVTKVLVANKSDKTKAVSPEKGKALAAEHGMEFFQTSAKTGENVNDAFTYIGREIKNKGIGGVTTGPVPGSTRVSMNPEQLQTTSEGKKSGCC